MNISAFVRGLECGGAILDTINRKPTIDLDEPDTIPVEKIDQDIHFNKVSFSYKNSKRRVLKGVSFKIEHGKTTALVGPSGSGKSTVIKLLERFYDPQEGEVIVNGLNLKALNLRSYRSRVGYVGQEPCLFNETIRENLLNSNPDASEEDIKLALKTAAADGFVSKLPKGLDSDVGAIGSKLSGGQKQRLAIARALIRNPDLLLFDEATSALDQKSESKVQEALGAVGKLRVTQVVVAHRLSTIKDADKIIVFQNGRIVEEGTHEELLTLDMVYAGLYKTQMNAMQANSQNLRLYMDKEVSSNNDPTKWDSLSEGKDYETDDEISELIASEVKSKNSCKSEDTQSTAKTSEAVQLGAYQLFSRLLKHNKPYSYIALILLATTIVGSGTICTCIPLNELIMTYSEDDNSYIRDKMKKFLPILVGLGIVVPIFEYISRYCLFSLSSSMITSLRAKLYGTLIKQPIEFFDKKENSTGQITAILSSDVKTITGASVESYGLLYEGLVALSVGVGFSFMFCWEMGLAGMFLAPINAFCMRYQVETVKMNVAESLKHQDFKRMLISDTIANHLTVASLAKEEVIIDRYYQHKSKNSTQTHINFFKAAKLALFFGISISCGSFMFYVCSRIISYKVEDGVSYKDLFLAYATIIWGSANF